MSHFDALVRKIENKTAVSGIVGLGYVGLPLAVEFARAGLPVVGFDVTQGKVDMLNRGESYIQDVPTAEVARHVSIGDDGATAAQLEAGASGTQAGKQARADLDVVAALAE